MIKKYINKSKCTKSVDITPYGLDIHTKGVDIT